MNNIVWVLTVFIDNSDRPVKVFKSKPTIDQLLKDTEITQMQAKYLLGDDTVECPCRYYYDLLEVPLY